MNLSRRSFLAGAAASGVTVSSLSRATSEGAPPVVSVADFGARPDGTNARAGVRTAIARLPRKGGAILHFPPGIYRFGGGRDPGIHVVDIEDLTIDAPGCTFLFQDVALAVGLERCRRAHLRGFAIDWERPPFSQGDVIASARDGLSADIRIDAEFPVDGSERIYALGTYDRKLGHVAKGGSDDYKAVTNVTLASRQLLRLGFNRRLALRQGDTVVLRHDVPGHAHAISLTLCDGAEVDHVSVYASCSMALVGYRCRDLAIRGFDVKPKPGSTRLLSTNADAIHLADGLGTIDIRDCTLTGMGDDCINVTGQFFRVSELRDLRTATVLRANRGEQRPFNPNDLPRNGERFMIFRSGSLEPLGEAVVAGAEAGPSETLHFVADLPSQIRPGDFFCDASNLSALTVSHCRFPGNRARGILAHNDAVIKNCFFAHQSLQGILLTSDLGWIECGPADRVSIINNEFHDTIRMNRGQLGTISVGPPITMNGNPVPGGAIANHKAVISGNVITDSGGSAIRANAVDGLTIENNRIERTAGTAIALGGVRHVVVKDNRCTPASTLTLPSAYRSEVTATNNSGVPVKLQP